MEKLSHVQLESLAVQFGGQWCNCIDKTLLSLSAQKLAVYCESKRYPMYHPIVTDDMGTRYGYRLGVAERLKDGVVEPYVLVAGFGEFPGLPFDTLQSVLVAIVNIGKSEERPPQEVCADVVKMDEKLAPKSNLKELTELPGVNPAMAQTAKRHFTPNVVEAGAVESTL